MTFLAAALLIAQPPRPADLISRMMALYAEAKTIKGTISLDVQAGNSKVTVETTVQVDRPGRRLFIEQVKQGRRREVFRVISDGKGFVYTNPIEELRTQEPYLLERASRMEPDPARLGARRQVDMALGEIYAAGVQGLADRSAPLDIVMARPTDLQYLVNQLATVTSGGEVLFRDRKVQLITGRWRPYRDANDSADYDLFIAADGSLAGYRMRERYAVEGKPVAVTSTWEVKLETNTTLDGGVFKLRTK